MITAEQNETLTRVGPGTPMGNYIRKSWIPALLSKDLSQAGGHPKGVRLLGEDLVAFRTTNGDVGLLPDSCPHRRAKLTLARNEPRGLRCIYLGWLIDECGKVLETPN